MEYTEYVTCPACGSNVAVVTNSNFLGNLPEIGHCNEDCGYKWFMLIEPDPETYPELKEKAEIVEFLEDLDDVMYEDKERYQRILKYSDLSGTYDGELPLEIQKKRDNFFKNYFLKLTKKENEMYENYILKFLNGNEDYLNNVKYVLVTVCGMKLNDKNGKLNKIEYTSYNKNALNLIISRKHINELFKKLKNEYKVKIVEKKPDNELSI